MTLARLDAIRAAVTARPWCSLGVALVIGASLELSRSRDLLVRQAARDVLAAALRWSRVAVA
jgi:hypothetical protein